MLKDMISKLLDFGLTQKEISKKTGVPQSAISRVFTGEQSEVSYSAGKSIEALYNSTVAAESVSTGPVLPVKSSLSPAPAPAPECGSIDPRHHPERRSPDKRQRIDRRKEGA